MISTHTADETGTILAKALVAVVTTYRPDEGVLKRFQQIQAICPTIILVDNTPGGHPFGALPAGFIVIQDGRNKGLGPALNAGIARARQTGAAAVVLFDQDSTPSADGLARMLRGLAVAQEQHGPHVCLGPVLHDDSVAVPDRGSAGQRAKFAAATDLRFERVISLPTSGMILGLNAWRDADGFADDLFLDLVDFEWCWRSGRRGWTFLRALDVIMPHRLGLAERRFFGLTYHVPAPYRHYFQFRDTLRLSWRSYVPMYPRIRLLGVLPLKLFIYPFILDHGRERLVWMVRGIRDALRGVSGIGAAGGRLGRD